MELLCPIDLLKDLLSEFDRSQRYEKLFQQINSNSGLGSYGLKEVIDYLKYNMLLLKLLK